MSELNKELIELVKSWLQLVDTSKSTRFFQQMTRVLSFPSFIRVLRLEPLELVMRINRRIDFFFWREKWRHTLQYKNHEQHGMKRYTRIEALMLWISFSSCRSLYCSCLSGKGCFSFWSRLALYCIHRVYQTRATSI